VRLVCVDASIALKWVLPEPDHEVALGLLRNWLAEDRRLVAPLPFVYEVDSVIRSHAHRGTISLDAANAAFETVGKSPVRIMHNTEIRALAWQLAEQLNLSTLYDAAYLALTQHVDGELWTADRRLYNQVSGAIPTIRIRLLRA